MKCLFCGKMKTSGHLSTEKTNMDSKKHLDYIDIAKGLGMILVVMGHTIIINTARKLATFTIFAKHLKLKAK